VSTKRGLAVICAFTGLVALLGIASPPQAIARARQVQPPLTGTARAALAARPAVDPAAQACGGLPGFNQATADEIMAGRLTIDPFPTATIAPRRDGAINWNLNPFNHPTWQQTFQSGSWIEMLIVGYLSGAPNGDAYLARAEAITKSWLAGVPIGNRDSHVLICLSEGFPGQAWIDDQIDASVTWLATHWQGPWNHGLVQDLKLMRIACAYPATAFGGDALTWRQTAMRQILSSFQPNPLAPSINTQGDVNEQATGYEKFVYDLWQSGVPVLKACGYTLPSDVLARIAKMPAFLAAATQPDGNLVQIGDTYVEQPPWDLPKPSQLVSVYNGGYVFGRSRFGPNGTFYSLRFGPGRQVHGHNDHMGVTYYSRGRNLIVNAGHTGYEVSPYRAYIQSPQAASTFIAPGQRFRPSAPTTLVADEIGSTSQYYQFTDYAFGGQRNRSVFVHDRPDFMLVLDRSCGAPAYQQLWHLDPALKVSQLTATRRWPPRPPSRRPPVPRRSRPPP
jgi:hypothetical protein